MTKHTYNDLYINGNRVPPDRPALDAALHEGRRQSAPVCGAQAPDSSGLPEEVRGTVRCERPSGHSGDHLATLDQHRSAQWKPEVSTSSGVPIDAMKAALDDPRTYADAPTEPPRAMHGTEAHAAMLKLDVDTLDLAFVDEWMSTVAPEKWRDDVWLVVGLLARQIHDDNWGAPQLARGVSRLWESEKHLAPGSRMSMVDVMAEVNCCRVAIGRWLTGWHKMRPKGVNMRPWRIVGAWAVLLTTLTPEGAARVTLRDRPSMYARLLRRAQAFYAARKGADGWLVKWNDRRPDDTFGPRTWECLGGWIWRLAMEATDNTRRAAPTVETALGLLRMFREPTHSMHAAYAAKLREFLHDHPDEADAPSVEAEPATRGPSTLTPDERECIEREPLEVDEPCDALCGNACYHEGYAKRAYPETSDLAESDHQAFQAVTVDHKRTHWLVQWNKRRPNAYHPDVWRWLGVWAREQDAYRGLSGRRAAECADEEIQAEEHNVCARFEQLRTVVEGIHRDELLAGWRWAGADVKGVDMGAWRHVGATLIANERGESLLLRHPMDALVASLRESVVEQCVRLDRADGDTARALFLAYLQAPKADPAPWTPPVEPLVTLDVEDE